MKLTYTGPHDAVDVPLPDGRWLTVEHDQTEEFPKELADALLEQEGNWAPAKASKAKTDTAELVKPAVAGDAPKED